MKTSKKLISIIVAVALLISTLAVVTTMTSSADTSSVSVWNGEFSAVQGGTPVITKNDDGTVTVSTGEGLNVQYQYQFAMSSFDKDKITAAGNKVKLKFQINSAKKSTGDDDNAQIKIFALGGTGTVVQPTWIAHDPVTFDLDFTTQDWNGNYQAIALMNYGNDGGLKDVTVTLGFFVEGQGSAETTATSAEQPTTPGEQPTTAGEQPTTAGEQSAYTAGSIFSKFADLHYAKSEGWQQGISQNSDDLSAYVNVDPKGNLSYNIPAGVINSQQIYANFSQDLGEKDRMIEAIKEANAGSGKLMFDITVIEAKDASGNDTTVGFRYSNIAGKSLSTDTNYTIPLTTGKTERIIVDIPSNDSAIAALDTYSFRLYFKNYVNWDNALTVLNVKATPIVVAVESGQTPVETTVAPVETTVAPVETTVAPVETTVAPVETTEPVIEKTNPTSDAEFKLADESTDPNTFVVSLDDVYGNVGDVVEFSAHIKNNPGVFASIIFLKYDPDVVSPVLVNMGTDMVVDATAGDVLPVLTAGTVNDVVDEAGNKLGYKYIPFLMENLSMTNSTKDGVLFTFKFEIVGKPAYGDTSSIVFGNYAETEWYALNFDDIDHDIKLDPTFDEGSVTVGTEVPETTTEAPVETTVAPVETTEAPVETTVAKPELVNEGEFTAYDADKFNIVVDEVSGKAGDTVDVNISINNNPGIWAGQIYLAYDPAVVNPIEVPDPDGNPWNVVQYFNVMDGIDVTDAYLTDYTVDGYNFKMLPVVFANGPLKNFSTNGVLATVKFKIADDAQDGDFSNVVFVNYGETKVINTAAEIIDVAVKEGKISALGESTTVAPVETTVAPVETTVAPVETTVAPVETTVAPVETTVAPVETTVAPVETTVAPATTEAPATETPADVTTTTAENGNNGGSADDDVDTGAAAAPLAALALAAGAAFVAFKARKK